MSDLLACAERITVDEPKQDHCVTFPVSDVNQATRLYQILGTVFQRPVSLTEFSWSPKGYRVHFDTAEEATLAKLSF